MALNLLSTYYVVMCYTSDNIQNIKRDNIYLFSNLLYTVLLKYVNSGDTDDH